MTRFTSGPALAVLLYVEFVLASGLTAPRTDYHKGKPFKNTEDFFRVHERAPVGRWPGVLPWKALRRSYRMSDTALSNCWATWMLGTIETTARKLP